MPIFKDKNEKLDTEGEIDASWADEFGDDFGSDMDALFGDPPKKDRTPVEEIKEGVISGFKDGTAPAEVTNTLKKVLPKHFRNTVSEVSSTASNVQQVLNEGLAEVNKEVNTMRQNLVRGMKLYEKQTPKMFQGIVGKLQEKLASGIKNESYQGNQLNETQQQLESIKSELNINFNEGLTGLSSQLIESQENIQKENIVRDMLQEVQEKQRFQTQQELLLGIQKGINRSSNYQEQIAGAYARKSLEIGMLQLAVQRNIHNALVNKAGIDKGLLENIQKNTALPDVVKYRKTEAMKDMLMRHTLGGMGQSLSGFIGNFKDQFTQNILGQMQSTVGNVSGTLGQVNMGLDMGIGGVEMMREMGESKSFRESVASGIGGLLARKLVKGLGKKAFQGADGEQGRIGGLLQSATNFMEFLPQNMMRLKEKDTDNKFLAFLQSMIPDFNQQRVGHNLLSRDNLSQPAPFDVATRTSIVDIIPQLLSKIHQSTEGIRTTLNPNQILNDGQLLEFSFDRGELTTRKTIDLDFERQLHQASQVETTSISAFKIVNSIDPKQVLGSDLRRKIMKDIILHGDFRKGLKVDDFLDRSWLKSLSDDEWDTFTDYMVSELGAGQGSTSATMDKRRQVLEQAWMRESKNLMDTNTNVANLIAKNGANTATGANRANRLGYASQIDGDWRVNKEGLVNEHRVANLLNNTSDEDIQSYQLRLGDISIDTSIHAFQQSPGYMVMNGQEVVQNPDPTKRNKQRFVTYPEWVQYMETHADRFIARRKRKTLGRKVGYGLDKGMGYILGDKWDKFKGLTNQVSGQIGERARGVTSKTGLDQVSGKADDFIQTVFDKVTNNAKIKAKRFLLDAKNNEDFFFLEEGLGKIDSKFVNLYNLYKDRATRQGMGDVEASSFAVDKLLAIFDGVDETDTTVSETLKQQGEKTLDTATDFIDKGKGYAKQAFEQGKTNEKVSQGVQTVKTFKDNLTGKINQQIDDVLVPYFQDVQGNISPQYGEVKDQVMGVTKRLLQKVKKPTEQDIQDALILATELLEESRNTLQEKGGKVVKDIKDIDLKNLNIPDSMKQRFTEIKDSKDVKKLITRGASILSFLKGVNASTSFQGFTDGVGFFADQFQNAYSQNGLKGVTALGGIVAGNAVNMVTSNISSKLGEGKDRLSGIIENHDQLKDLTQKVYRQFGQPGNPTSEEHLLSGDMKLNMKNNESDMEWVDRSDSRNDEIFAVYVKGEDSPRLLKSGFYTGRYIDEETKEVITEPADIKGVVLEAGTGEILIGEDDIAKGLVDYQGKDINATGLDAWVRNISRKFTSTKNVIKGIGLVAKKLYNAATFIPKLTMDTTDVYLPQENGKPILVLSRFKMMRGLYMNEDGSTIFGLRHIKGDIYNKDGTVAVTLDDFKKCVDYKGRPISKSYFIRRLRQTKDVLSFMVKPVTAPAKFLAKKAFQYLEKKGSSYSLRAKMGLGNIKDRLKNRLGFNEEESDELDEHGRPVQRGFLARAKGVLRQASSLRHKVKRKGGVVVDEYTGEVRKGNFKERNEEQRREEQEKRKADEERIKKERDAQAAKEDKGEGILGKILKGLLGVGPMLLGGITTLGVSLLTGLKDTAKLITSGLGAVITKALEWFGKRYLIGKAVDKAVDAMDDFGDGDRKRQKGKPNAKGKPKTPKPKGRFAKFASNIGSFFESKGSQAVTKQAAKTTAKQATKTAGSIAAKQVAKAGAGLAVKQGLKMGVVAGAAAFLGPVGLALVGVAMALWTAWEIGSFIWDIVMSPNKIDHFRAAAYGINPNSSYRVKGILKLEEAVLDNTTIDEKTGKATIKEKITDDMKEAMKYFMGGDKGFDEAQNNPESVEAWSEQFQTWFDQRFKPVFIRHVEALHAVDPKVKLNKAFGAVMGDLKNGLVNPWLRKAWFSPDNPENPYHIEIDPFFMVEEDDEEGATADAGVVKQYFDIVHKAYDIDEKRLNAKTAREQKKQQASGGGVVSQGTGTPSPMLPGPFGTQGKAPLGMGGMGSPTTPLMEQPSSGGMGGINTPMMEKVNQGLGATVGNAYFQQVSNTDKETSGFADVGVVKASAQSNFKSNTLTGKYIDPLTALRMKVYGVDKLDQLTVNQLLELEMDALFDTVLPTNGGTPRIPSHRFEALRLKWATRLGWKVNDKGQMDTYSAWLRFRFLPVWFKFVQETYRYTQNKDIFEGLEKMNLYDRYALGETLSTLTVTYNGKDISVWELPMAPVFGQSPNMSPDSTLVNLENLKTGWSGDEYLEPSNRMIPKTAKDSGSGSTTATDTSTSTSLGGGLTNTVNQVLSGVGSTIGVNLENPGSTGGVVSTGGEGVFGRSPSSSNSTIGAFDMQGNYGPESNYQIKNVSADKKAVAVKLFQRMKELGWSDTEKNLFMATIDEETGHLKWLSEQGSQAYFAKKKYGAKWRGRGIIQLTHKDNYQKFANWVGRQDIMENPDLVASDPELAVNSGIYWWEDTKKRFKKFREAIANGDILNVSRAVNNGPGAIGNPNKTPNGIKKRFKFYQEYVNGKGFMQKLAGETGISGEGSPTEAVVQNTNDNNPLEAEANAKVIDTSKPAIYLGDQQVNIDEMSNPFGGGNNEGSVSTQMINFDNLSFDNKQGHVNASFGEKDNEYSMSNSTHTPTYADGTTGGKTVSNVKGRVGQLLAEASPELINLGKQSLNLNMSETLGRKPNPAEMNQTYMKLLYAAIGEYQMKHRGKGSFGTNQMHRTYQDQVRMKQKYGDKAAKPGKSNHGWGIAIDLNQNQSTTEDFFRSGIAGKWGFHRPLLNWSKAKEWWHVENKFVGQPKGKKNGDFMGDSVASDTGATLSTQETVDGAKPTGHTVLGGAPTYNGDTPFSGGTDIPGFDGKPRHIPQTSGMSSAQVVGGQTPGFNPGTAPTSGSSDPFRFGDVFTGQSDSANDMVRKVSENSFGTDFDIVKTVGTAFDTVKNTFNSDSSQAVSGGYANTPTAPSVGKTKVLDDGNRNTSVVSNQQDFYNNQNKVIQTQQENFNKQQQALMDNVSDIMKEQLGVQKDIHGSLKEIVEYVKGKALGQGNSNAGGGNQNTTGGKRPLTGGASKPLLDVGIGGNPSFA